MRDRSALGKWAIIVHGGAKEIPDIDANQFREGTERAALAGSEILARGGSAVDAVVAAVRALEDDPTFNAGTGAVRNSEGYTELDAALMDGKTLDVGGVAALRSARSPILVAQAMLRREETLLVADGASQFARVHAPQALWRVDSPRVTAAGGDTVGCVAMDDQGNIAAGTSTGGLAGSPPGRVGDTPIPGSGLYAENGVGGVALSGSGERISRVALAAWAMNALPQMGPAFSADASMRRLEMVGGEGGIIVIGNTGELGWAYNSPDFAVAYATEARPVSSFTRSADNEPTTAKDGTI